MSADDASIPKAAPRRSAGLLLPAVVVAVVVAVVALGGNTATTFDGSLSGTLGDIIGSAVAWSLMGGGGVWFIYTRGAFGAVSESDRSRALPVLLGVGALAGALATIFSVVSASATSQEQIREILKSTLNSEAHDAADFKAETSAYSLPEIFKSMDPSWLAKSPDFDAARGKIKQYRAAIEKMVALQQRRHDEALAALQQAHIPNGLRVSARDGFEKGYDSSTQEENEGIDQLDELLKDIDRQLLFLQTIQSAWTIKSGDIQFARPDDLKTYRVNLATINAALAAVQRTSAKAAQSEAEKRADFDQRISTPNFEKQ